MLFYHLKNEVKCCFSIYDESYINKIVVTRNNEKNNTSFIPSTGNIGNKTAAKATHNKKKIICYVAHHCLLE